MREKLIALVVILVLFVTLVTISGFSAQIGDWIAIISGWFSTIVILLWIIALPTQDRRTKTGWTGEFSLPFLFIGIIAGYLSYYINEMAFITHVLGIIF